MQDTMEAEKRMLLPSTLQMIHGKSAQVWDSMGLRDIAKPRTDISGFPSRPFSQTDHS